MTFSGLGFSNQARRPWKVSVPMLNAQAYEEARTSAVQACCKYDRAAVPQVTRTVIGDKDEAGGRDVQAANREQARRGRARVCASPDPLRPILCR